MNELNDSEKLRIRAEKLHEENIQKHRYFKFGRKGPAFYIIISGLEYSDGIIRIKFGIAGCPSGNKQDRRFEHSIDSRLAEHRTLWPQLQVLFIVYTKNAQLLERNIKISFQNRINPRGHEIIENVNPIDVIQVVNNYLKLFDICEKEPSFHIEENLKLYNQRALMPILKQETVELIDQLEKDKSDGKNDK